MQLSQNFSQFLESLNKTKTEYLLVGGFAVISYGHNSTTGDMDLWINIAPKNLTRFHEALIEEGYDKVDVKEAISSLANNMKLSIWLDDDLVELLPIYSSILNFKEAYDKHKLMKISNTVEIPVIDIDHLIETKIKSGRDKDLWDASELKKRR